MTDIRLRDGRVHEVVTDKGTIECEVVVNAAGMYAPQIGRLVGVDVPIIPFGHQYLVTEPLDPPLRPLPTLRDPDNLVYFRTEVGGLVMGGYERKPYPWALDGVPEDFEARLLPEDWERMEELLQNSIERVPVMETQPVKMFFNGPEAFTPDAEFILGESDVPGFFVAAGFCAHGLAGAGGVGKVMAEWIVDGQPEWDLWHMDIRRFSRHYRSQRYALARAYEALSKYYDIKYPGEEKLAGRPLRVSSAYSRHRGARRRVRREGRLGARQLVRVERAGRRRGAAPARLGGRELVAGHRRRGAGDAERRRPVRRVELREARGARPGRVRRSSSGSAPTGSTSPSAPSSTRRC